MPAPSSLFTVGLCPTLQAVQENTSILCDFLPKDVDALAADASLVLQRCCLAEATRAPDKREEDEALISALVAVEPLLRHQKDRGAVLLTAFREALLTWANLQALLRMCDATHRTGQIRCSALQFFFSLGNERDMWNFNGKDDGSNFSLDLIRMLAKGLMDDRDAQPTGSKPNRTMHGRACNCRIRWEFLDRALVTSNADPGEVLHEIVHIDWRGLFKERSVPPSTADFAERYFSSSDADVFTTLHLTAVRALESDPTDSKAKDFLEVLGGCQKFLRTVLQRTAVPPCDRARAKATVMFVDAYFSCLTAPPTDRQTDRLVRRALPVLGRHLPPAELGLLVRWPDLLRESDDDRWRRFVRQYLADDCNDSGEEKAREDGEEGDLGGASAPRAPVYGSVSAGGATATALCDNCGVPESDLPLASTLLRCSRCRRAAYCGRACQVEHWRRSHKHACQATVAHGSSHGDQQGAAR